MKTPRHLSLDGPWRFLPADPAVAPSFFLPEFDDDAWVSLHVPGHQHREFSGAETLFARRRTSRPLLSDGERAWLRFEGIYADGDLWVDGHYLGTTTGPYATHVFEITSEVRHGTGPLTVALEVTSIPPKDFDHKRIIAGALTDGQFFPVGLQPGGLWGRVTLDITGPVRIATCRTTCTAADDRTGRLRLDLVLDRGAANVDPDTLRGDTSLGATDTSAAALTAEGDEVEVSGEAGTVQVVTPESGESGSAPAVQPGRHSGEHNGAGGHEPGGTSARLTATISIDDRVVEFARDVTLASGTTTLHWDLDVDRPPLWWPWRLGEQPTGLVEVAVSCADMASDETVRTAAFRTVSAEDYRFRINGEPFFFMGAAQGPLGPYPAEISDDAAADIVRRARDTNLDLLRIHTHIAPSALYEEADRLGVVIWQDFPAQGGYANQVADQAVKQAVAMIDQLADHPSIITWCARNESTMRLRTHEDADLGIPTANLSTLARLGASGLPSLQRLRFDRSVSRAMQAADPTRPVDPHSGVVPGASSKGTDLHSPFGWSLGHMADLAEAIRQWPRLGRCIGSFGSPAVPDTDGFAHPERWPWLDWAELSREHLFEQGSFHRRFPEAHFHTFDQWRRESQRYQADLLQLQVEDMRRIRWSPTGGFVYRGFQDGQAAISGSLIDHGGVAKPALARLRATCRTLLPMLDLRSGSVHVANESTVDFAGARLDVVRHTSALSLGSRSGSRTGRLVARWRGTMLGSSVTFVGSLPLELIESIDAAAGGPDVPIFTLILDTGDDHPIEHIYTRSLLTHLGAHAALPLP
ncbi:MAG: hypothetical protein H6512_13630 [Acidimicrobiia bacterium]|nr:hypothetical protein [Acidimicrobiia bacterium]